MKAPFLFLLGATCGAAVMAGPKAITHVHAAIGHFAHGGKAASDTRAHTDAQFEFLANGTFEKVAPLFGADKERVWAAEWNPAFVYPQPAADREGMVFTVEHHHHQAVWVNTQLDLVNGRVQYAYVIPDAMVTLINLRLTREGDKTRLFVTYERTSLSAEADEHVRRMGEGDRGSGPEWEKDINGYLSQPGK